MKFTVSAALVAAVVSAPLLIVACRHDQPAAVQPPVMIQASAASFQRDNPRVGAIVSAVSIDSLQYSIDRLVAFRTRHSDSDTLSDSTGIGAARRWIYNRFEQISTRTGGRLTVSFDDFDAAICGSARRHRNVVAVLPGTANPERRLLVSGHYDSRNEDRCDASDAAAGANDDGSGVAAVLELARLLSAESLSATLVFVAFTGEEQGLFGSRNYAAKARARGDRIDAMITNDIIGNIVGGSGVIDSTRVRCFSEGPAGSPHRQLARYIKLQGEAWAERFSVSLIPMRDRPGRGGDQFAFVENGYTAARLTEPEDNLAHQHNMADLPEFMSFPYLARVTRVNAGVLASLAGAPAAPGSPRVLVADGGEFVLSWTPGGGSVTRYLVGLRLGGSVGLDSLFAVEGATELRLPARFREGTVSVSAVNGAGNESLFSQEVLLQ